MAEVSMRADKFLSTILNLRFKTNPRYLFIEDVNDKKVEDRCYDCYNYKLSGVHMLVVRIQIKDEYSILDIFHNGKPDPI